MKKLSTLFLFVVLAFTAVSCSKTEGEPSNVFTDNDNKGINISLTWTASSAVDIDVLVFRSGSSSATYSGSSFNTTTETVNLPKDLTDGTYIVKYQHFSGSTSASVSSKIKAIDGNKVVDASSKSVTQGATVDAFNIVKSGNKYTINQL